MSSREYWIHRQVFKCNELYDRNRRDRIGSQHRRSLFVLPIPILSARLRILPAEPQPESVMIRINVAQIWDVSRLSYP